MTSDISHSLGPAGLRQTQGQDERLDMWSGNRGQMFVRRPQHEFVIDVGRDLATQIMTPDSSPHIILPRLGTRCRVKVTTTVER